MAVELKTPWLYLKWNVAELGCLCRCSCSEGQGRQRVSGECLSVFVALGWGDKRGTQATQGEGQGRERGGGQYES